MKRLVTGTMALLFAACAGSAGPIGGTPSSSAAIRSSTSSPSVAASTGAALDCRLPVVQWTQTAQGAVPSGGFISFPGGQFSPDPASEIIVDGSRYRTVARPYLYGGGPGPGAYDLQMRRWLPVTPRNVSPDGSHYAYQEEFGTIHDVDIATGRDRALKAPEGPDTVLYYAREGIYFNHEWEGPTGPGLWLLNPVSGKVDTVFTDRPVQAVGGFAAWLPDVNSADPHPVFSQYTGDNLPNQILRRDLNGGPTVRWFYQPGKTVWVVGFDQDKKPLIAVGDGGLPGTEVWQVPAANQGHVVAHIQEAWVIGDTHGIWFTDDRGVWLYRGSQGLMQLSTIKATVVGPCR